MHINLRMKITIKSQTKCMSKVRNMSSAWNMSRNMSELISLLYRSPMCTAVSICEDVGIALLADVLQPGFSVLCDDLRMTRDSSGLHS